MPDELFLRMSDAVTRDEHLAILEFIDRAVGGTPAPVDVEADAIIRAMFKRNPEAAYRMTKLAMTLAEQVAALSAAQAAQEVRAPLRNWLGGWFERRNLSARRAPVIS